VYKLLINGEELTWGSDDLYDYLAQYGQMVNYGWLIGDSGKSEFYLTNCNIQLIASTPSSGGRYWQFWLFNGYKFLGRWDGNCTGAVRGFLNNVEDYNAQIAKEVSRRS
jgi:hypothetical protein